MADTLGADEVKVDALLYAGGARYELGDRLGVDDMLESLEVAKAINSAAHQARVYNNLGIVLRLEGRMPESLAMHDESLAVARRFGMEANVQFALGALPYRFYETGRWDESLETADAFLAGPGGEGGNSSTAHMAIALVSLGRDDPERAVAEARQAVEIAKSSMAVLPKFPGLAILAYVLTATGDVRGGREAGRELIALGREVRKRIAFGGDAHPIWAWDRLGLLEEMLAATATGPRTPWLEAAEAVAAGDWAGAADIYERCGSPVSTALARLHSGRDADVRAALDYFRSVRAPFYERQAEAKLAAIA